MAYPEKIAAMVCNPVSGIASQLKYFPSIAELKSSCDAAASEYNARLRLERMAARRAAPQPKTEQEDTTGLYMGPMEEIRPGDVISWNRMDEYKEFMRTKKGIQNVKNWGVNDKWVDSGQRPFALPDKPIVPTKEDPNPFDP